MNNEMINRLRSETAGCAHVNHLNNAGSGLMPDVVTRAVLEHIQLESEIGGYEAAALRVGAIQEMYVRAGRLFNCRASNIAFTSSATDSYTRALSSIPFEPGDVILADNDDFISNQIQFLSLQRRFGVRLERIRNAAGGGVDLEDLAFKLDSLRPRLLAITHIPTNSGLVQPVMEIAEIFARYSDSTWYILDACQSAGQLTLDMQALGCDFMSVTTRKFMRGPRGTGLLYVSDRALNAGLEPLFIDMRGAAWKEKDHYEARSGAIRFEDWEFAYALLLGTSEAIQYCLEIGTDRIWKRVSALAGLMRDGLARIPGVRVLDRGPTVGALVTFTAAGSSAELLVRELLKRRINVVPSYRGFAVIDFDEKGVEWAVRASPHYYNTEEEVLALVDAVREILAMA